MFHTLLIANRGEIACRIIRTARRLGIRTVAVFSDADAKAQHVALADAAYAIGPAPARDSYLNIPAVLHAAARSGAQAVHPGYGFLSEQAGFAEACAAAGLVFVGPPPAAVRAMGGKAEAKALMQQAGVPLVPGYHGAAQDGATLLAEAMRIGFPVLVKASAGGGGKGMRVAPQAADFPAALAGAQREARAAFGDDRVLIEKYLQQPRHIEIQVFADTHGTTLHLGERDCSIQRRHQKVLEEAPAPGMTEAMRARMGAAAVAAARAVDYVGAGTVEFIVADGQFHFMEMNTRLQVEHPVTEMITGLDLVEWQLRVAAGEALPWRQEDLALRGHAIEARLYAEDPAQAFRPSIGTLTHLRLGQRTPAVRLDCGVRAGDAITPYYDPMIAKLIVQGDDRAQAVRRMADALAACEVAGVATNLHLLRAIVGHPAYRRGDLDTGFIARHDAALLAGPPAPTLAALAAAAWAAGPHPAALPADPWAADPWAAADSWRLNGPGWQTLDLAAGGQRFRLRLRRTPDGLLLEHDGAQHSIAVLDDAAAEPRFTIAGERVAPVLVHDHGQIIVALDGETWSFTRLDPLAPPQAEAAGAGRVLAPIPGRIAAVLVAEGDTVAKGQALVVLEAMKMELTLSAATAGRVDALRCAVGEMVADGRELVVLAEAET